MTRDVSAQTIAGVELLLLSFTLSTVDGAGGQQSSPGEGGSARCETQGTDETRDDDWRISHAIDASYIDVSA